MGEGSRLQRSGLFGSWVLLASILGLIAAAALAYPRAREAWWLHRHPTPPGSYLVPVQGVDRSELEPNYGAYRPLGPHEGIDILAAAGTPVIAAAGGIVVDDRTSEIGGNVLWILGAGRRLYYYAHMSDLAEGVGRGQHVSAGQTIGSVGASGNAVGTPPHLHFAIYTLHSSFFFTRDDPIDPYPLLIDTGRAVQVASGSSSESNRSASAPSAIPVDPEKALELAPSAIVERAEAVQTRFGELLPTLDPFLGVDADLDSRVVFRLYRLASHLKDRVDEFRRASAKPGAERLRDLEPLARELGTRLFVSSSSLALLLDEQQRCRPRHLGILLSALESLALALEVPGSAEAAGATSLYGWIFDSHLPGVVPRTGGRAVLVGSGLWRDSEPEVSLVDRESESDLAQLEALQTPSEDRIAVVVNPSIIEAQAGRCVSVRVSPTRSSGLLWWKRLEIGRALHVPLCVPRSYRSQYRVAGFLGYRIPVATHVLESNEILFFNTSCDEPKQVSRTLEWPLHPQGRIVDMGRSKLYEINASSVDCRLAKDSISCSGELGPASCDESGRTDTEWHHMFSPTEEYPDLEEHRSAAISPGIDVLADDASTCVELRRAESSDETAMWFDLFAINGHQQNRFFSAPRRILRNGANSRYEAESMVIEADFDPASSSELARICVAIQSPQCRY